MSLFAESLQGSPLPFPPIPRRSPLTDATQRTPVPDLSVRAPAQGRLCCRAPVPCLMLAMSKVHLCWRTDHPCPYLLRSSLRLPVTCN